MIQRPGSEVVDRALEWLQADAEAPVLCLGPPLRRAHAVRSARAVSVALPAHAETAPTTPKSRSADAQVGRLLDAPARRRPPRRHARRRRRPITARCSASMASRRTASSSTKPRRTSRSIISGPGVPPGVVSDQVRIVDVMPTALVAARRAGTASGAGHEPDAARPRPAPRPRGAYARAGIRAITTAGASCARFRTGASSSFARRGRSCTTWRPIAARSTTDRRSTRRGSTCSAARSTSSSPAPRERARRRARGRSMRKRKNASPRWAMSPAAST